MQTRHANACILNDLLRLTRAAIARTLQTSSVYAKKMQRDAVASVAGNNLFGIG
jgi:hypothetical protein